MFHSGGRVFYSGNLDKVIWKKIEDMLNQFIPITDSKRKERELRPAMVRSMLFCDIIVILDSQNVWITAQKSHGMPDTRTFDESQQTFSIQDIYDCAKWDFGFDDPFVIPPFPREILEQSNSERTATLTAIAQTHVEAEFQRVQLQMNIIQINPIFGPASYSIDPRLAFVLMPFTPELTKIYEAFVKPTVESFNLVCRRADDIDSNNVIMHDIWKSTCEARIIIADLSRLNPNVMYELGIAHTLGKETILIYQVGSEKDKFPFDVTHIRRIEYDDTATGGKKLEQKLKGTLASVLSPKVIS